MEGILTTCPQCGNTRDNVNINLCTICDEHHIDVQCARCGHRWHRPMGPQATNEFNENTVTDKKSV